MPSAMLEPVVPSADESRLADAAARTLHRHEGQPLQVTAADNGETVQIPAIAAALLLRLLRDLAAGNAVTLIPIHAVLTTQEAADILGVSRPFVVKLIESGKLRHQMVGTHRRILFRDLMEYKRATDASREQALRDLTAEAQELGLGY